MSNYDKQTINSSNPFVRYAHRNRIKRSIEFVSSRLASGRILDYGCGSGFFVSQLNNIKPNSAIGYEPFMLERSKTDLPIYSDYEDALRLGPFHTITLFETIEHLTMPEIDDFLRRCDQALDENGSILISAPIEIGPAVLLKEASRSLLKKEKTEYQFFELLSAAFLGIPGKRAENIKSSHKGFDFREFIDLLASKNWDSNILGYGPLPLISWYGNSQMFLLAHKKR